MFGDSSDDYIVGVYSLLRDRDYRIKISRDKMNEFEKDKVILHSRNYVYSDEVRKIFYDELLNNKNKDLMDTINSTRGIVDDLNYSRSPEYKEKILLDKIHKIYDKVKGKLLRTETLYNGEFLQVLREIYSLPDEMIVTKEKVLKNNGKNSVIVIALTSDGEYIIAFQNRINNSILAEFPSENDIFLSTINASKRELMEETGFESNGLFIPNQMFTSPGIDNSKTFIVVANGCVKTNEVSKDGTEVVDYGIFTFQELKYMIQNNVMNGAINKLAFYSLLNNTTNDDYTYLMIVIKYVKFLRKKKIL